MEKPQVRVTAERTVRFNTTALKYSDYCSRTSDEPPFPSTTTSEGHNCSRERTCLPWVQPKICADKLTLKLLKNICTDRSNVAGIYVEARV
jgi:hypothetical protein